MTRVVRVRDPCSSRGGFFTNKFLTARVGEISDLAAVLWNSIDLATSEIKVKKISLNQNLYPTVAPPNFICLSVYVSLCVGVCLRVCVPS